MKEKKDTQTPATPSKKVYGVKLKSVGDCRRALNKLINDVYKLKNKDKFELDKLKAVTYAINTVLKTFEIEKSLQSSADDTEVICPDVPSEEECSQREQCSVENTDADE